ncbi:hypothetical protein CYMTET_13968 [Cymbomonas tetramitiformis]|uniref:guanylate cyclase n=1 Tax=Cymbomonas tetramitiformis TaxID=36881 RepID=A0AAE0GHH2_9CHLO|nr:hypothetical protein CYMTET_13968 [Cymbomonas tetramitiformis]
MSHAELFSQAIPAFADIDSNQHGNVSVYEYGGVLEAFTLFLSQTIESGRGGVYPASSSTNDDLERGSLFHGGRSRLSSDSDSSGVFTGSSNRNLSVNVPTFSFSLIGSTVTGATTVVASPSVNASRVWSPLEALGTLMPWQDTSVKPAREDLRNEPILQVSEEVYPSVSREWHPVPSTVVDCEFAGWWLDVRHVQRVVLENLEIRGCNHTHGDLLPDFGKGGALFVLGAADLVIKNTIWRQNMAVFHGGAMWLSQSRVAISNSMFLQNAVVQGMHWAMLPENIKVSGVKMGGAIHMENCVHSMGHGLTMELVTFEGNRCEQNGGAVAIEDGSATVRDTEFTDNGASMHGGALSATRPEVILVENCTFRRNIARDAAGAVQLVNAMTRTSRGQAAATIVGSYFEENAVYGFGGALDLDHMASSTMLALALITGVEVSIQKCRFVGNSAQTSGGAVRSLYSTVEMLDTQMRAGSAGEQGGAVMLYSSALTLTGSALVKNQAAYGGALHASTALVTMLQCSLLENSATQGGGMWADAKVTFCDTVFSRNTAKGDGGGMYLTRSETGECTGLEVTNNVAGQGGGGIFLDRALNCTSSEFNENRASYGGNLAGPYSSLEPSQLMSACQPGSMCQGGLVGICSTLLFSAITSDGAANTSMAVHLQECAEDEEVGDDRTSCQHGNKNRRPTWLLTHEGDVRLTWMLTHEGHVRLTWAFTLEGAGHRRKQVDCDCAGHTSVRDLRRHHWQPMVSMETGVFVAHSVRTVERSELALLCYSAHAAHVAQPTTRDAWSGEEASEHLPHRKSDKLYFANFKAHSITYAEVTMSASDRAARERIKNIPVLSGLAQAVALRRSVRQHLGRRFQFFATRLSHPNLMAVLGASREPSGQAVVVTETPDMSLHDAIHTPVFLLDISMSLSIVKQIASALAYLHGLSRGPTLHTTLTTRHIFLDGNFAAKVMLPVLKAFENPKVCYTCPRVLGGDAPSTASDVYSFGMVLYELFVRRKPFEDMGSKEVLAHLLDRDAPVPLRPEVRPTDSIPPRVMEIMLECWNKNPQRRPSFMEILERLDEVQTSMRHTLAKIKRNSALLHDILPTHVAAQLAEGKKVEPESFDCVTIFFSDIVGFTNISQALEPRKVMEMLDRLYAQFDVLAQDHGVFKVETIGDAYMCVANLAEKQEDHAARIARFARDAIKAAATVQERQWCGIPRGPLDVDPATDSDHKPRSKC